VPKSLPSRPLILQARPRPSLNSINRSGAITGYYFDGQYFSRLPALSPRCLHNLRFSGATATVGVSINAACTITDITFQNRCTGTDSSANRRSLTVSIRSVRRRPNPQALNPRGKIGGLTMTQRCVARLSARIATAPSQVRSPGFGWNLRHRHQLARRITGYYNEGLPRGVSALTRRTYTTFEAPTCSSCGSTLSTMPSVDQPGGGDHRVFL